MPDGDSATNIGGAIDTTKRVAFTKLAAASVISVVSSDGADTTQTVTIYGLDSSGVAISEALSLNGTTQVTGAKSFERIRKIVVDSAHAGTISVTDSGSASVVDIETGVLEIRRPFYGAVADVAGGSAKTYYEKVFIKNTNATTALTSALIKELADPSGNVTFAVEATLDGTDTNGAGNNRQVAPAGYTFANTDQSVANSGNLSPGSAQGVWLKLSLAAGAAAANTSWTVRTSGETT